MSASEYFLTQKFWSHETMSNTVCSPTARRLCTATFSIWKCQNFAQIKFALLICNFLATFYGTFFTKRLPFNAFTYFDRSWLTSSIKESEWGSGGSRYHSLIHWWLNWLLIHHLWWLPWLLIHHLRWLHRLPWKLLLHVWRSYTRLHLLHLLHLNTILLKILICTVVRIVHI